MGLVGGGSGICSLPICSFNCFPTVPVRGPFPCLIVRLTYISQNSRTWKWQVVHITHGLGKKWSLSQPILTTNLVVIRSAVTRGLGFINIELM